MTYWERRWAADAARAHREADALAADISRLHMRAAARLQAMAGRIRQRFRAAYALNEEEAAALLAAPAGREMYLELLAEIERLGPKNPMRGALLAKAAAPGYAYRISVAEAMLQELDAVTAHLAQQEETLIRAHLTRTLQDKASRAGYLIQLEAGVGFRFHPISGELAREMLRRPWSGMEFSGRIWRNREALAELLNTVLLEGLTAGNSAQAMAQEIAESMNVSIQRAKTLVRTETTYVCSQADLHAYAEAEITAYRYCATLDMRTSRVCRALDGKEFETAEAVAGRNYPPMHPNCRSVTRPAIGQEELARMERWARDPITGKGVKVPADMTYAQWRGMQAETYGETLEEREKRVTPDRKGAEGDKKKRLKVAKTVEKTGESSILKEIEVPRSLGAASKRYPVKLPESRQRAKLFEGQTITGKTFAGKGTNTDIREKYRLESDYKIPASEWEKVSGVGYIILNGKKRKAELHWYQVRDEIFEMKVKRYIDED